MPSDFATADTSSYNDPTVNKLLATASNDPSKAIEWTQGAQQIQQNQIKISSDQITLGRQKLAAADQVFGAIGSDPTQANAQARIMEAVKAGAVDYDTATQGFAQLMPLGDDPQKIRAWAFDHMARNATYDQQLQNMGMQAPSLVDVGDKKVPVTAQSGLKPSINAAGGAPLQNGMTPGDKISSGRVVMDGVGGKTFKPGSQLYDSQGNYIGGQGAGQGSGGSGDAFVDAANGRGPGGGSPTPPAGSGQGTSPTALPGAPTPLAPAASPPPAAGAGVPPGHVALSHPPLGGPNSGVQVTAPANAAAAGAGAPTGQAAPAPAGGAAGPAPVGAPSAAMMTPSAQSLPVITKDQATAAFNAFQAGKATAVERNLLRGYAIQNNGTLKNLGAFEPQPAGVGAGVVVPPQPTAGQGGASAPPAPASGAVSPGRRPPVPVQAPGAGQGGSQSSMSGVGPGGLTESLSPGQQASLTAGANGYAALSADVSAPTGVNQRVFQLRTALDALRNTQTGLGTAQRQQLVGYMASLPGGLDKWMPGVDPNSATAYDVATKYLNAYALNTPGAARSDAGLSTAQSANANTSGMMQRAAMDVTTSNIGLELGKRALANAFEKSGADPGTFNKFAQQWGQGVDPRAFALGDMTPAERSTLFNSLQGQQRADFRNTIRKGMAAGVLRPSDLTGATGNGP